MENRALLTAWDFSHLICLTGEEIQLEPKANSKKSTAVC